MGSPEFAVPSLETILAAGHSVPLVFTQPDRVRARGRRELPTPVKAFARSQGLEVATPETLEGAREISLLRGVDPDIVVVVAYGKLLPQELLGLPRLGCINVHASLLPKYRGAAPIERAIMAGERTTGVTTMYVAEGWDTGDIILQEEVPIGENATAGELRKELATRGARLLSRTLELVRQGDAPRVPQDDGAATFAPRIRPEELVIDWSRPARAVHNLVRAVSPRPGARTKLHGRWLKVFMGVLGPAACCGQAASRPLPGTVLGRGPCGEIVVQTGDGAYLVRDVQPEAGRRMEVVEFLRGHPVPPGTVLG